MAVSKDLTLGTYFDANIRDFQKKIDSVKKSLMGLVATSSQLTKAISQSDAAIGGTTGRTQKFKDAIKWTNKEFANAPVLIQAEKKALIKLDNAFVKHLRNTGLAPDVIKRVHAATDIWRVRQAQLAGQIDTTSKGLKHFWKSTDNSTATTNKAAVGVSNLAARTKLAAKDFTDFGNVTAKTSDRSKKFHEGLRKLKESFGSAGPLFRSNAKALVKVDDEIINLINSTKKLPAAKKKAYDSINTLEVLFKKQAGTLKSVGNVLRPTTSRIEDLAKKSALAAKDFTDFGKISEKNADRSKRFHRELGQLRDTFGSSGPVFREAAKALTKNNDAFLKTVTSGNKSKAAIDKAIAAWNGLNGVQRINAGTNKYVNGQIKAVTTATYKATVATKKGETAYKGFNKQLSHVHGGLAKVKSAMAVTLAYGASSAILYTFINGFKAAYDEIVKFDQGLKNVQAASWV